MRESFVKKTPEGKSGESEKHDYQTPDIYEVSSLKIDSRLSSVRIKSLSDTVYTDSSQIAITVELPRRISGADILLFNNGKKKDIFYQVGSGEYIFRNIFLDDSVNNLVFLYRLGSRRSLPAKLVVIKESGR